MFSQFQFRLALVTYSNRGEKNSLWRFRGQTLLWWRAHPAGQQQPGAIRCSVVGEPHVDPVLGQLMGVRGAHDVISLDLWVGDLDDKRKQKTIDRIFFSFFFKGVFKCVCVCQGLTWQQISLLDSRTISRYLGVLYLFLSWTTSRLRA